MVKSPEILILHRDNLHGDEILIKQGYRITTPLRTLIDVIQEGMLADDLLAQATLNAKQMGLITKHAVEKDLRYPAWITKKLLKMMETTL